MILKLARVDEGLAAKVELLEMAVYKMKSKGGKTKFDEIAEKFLEVEMA